MSTAGSPEATVAQAHATASPTEMDAAARAAGLAGKLRPRVLALVADAGDAGLTATEVYELYRAVYGEPRGGLYSLAPRLSELERSGWVDKGEFVRGHRASYVATAAGRSWAAGIEVAA